MDVAPTLVIYDKLAAAYKSSSGSTDNTVDDLIAIIRTGIQIIFSVENSLATIAKCQQIVATPVETK